MLLVNVVNVLPNLTVSQQLLNTHTEGCAILPHSLPAARLILSHSLGNSTNRVFNSDKGKGESLHPHTLALLLSPSTLLHSQIPPRHTLPCSRSVFLSLTGQRSVYQRRGMFAEAEARGVDQRPGQDTVIGGKKRISCSSSISFSVISVMIY